MTPDIAKIAASLSGDAARVLVTICGKAPSRMTPEWFRIEKREYDALRRRKLIGGVWSFRDEDMGDEKGPNRFCYALPLGLAVRDILIKDQQ